MANSTMYDTISRVPGIKYSTMEVALRRFVVRTSKIQNLTNLNSQAIHLNEKYHCLKVKVFLVCTPSIE